MIGVSIFGLNWENGVVSGNVHRLKFWIGSVVAVEMLLKGVFGMNSRRSCVICGGSSCICGSCATQQILNKIFSRTWEEAVNNPVGISVVHFWTKVISEFLGLRIMSLLALCVGFVIAARHVFHNLYNA